MTPEAQRIAIAEACGWKFSPHWTLSGQDCYEHPSHDPKPVSQLPNYPNDLNAMHEAEMTLNWNEQESFQADNYRDALTKECGHDRDIIHVATAAQRAEAFLRTIGKWEASK